MKNSNKKKPAAKAKTGHGANKPKAVKPKAVKPKAVKPKAVKPKAVKRASHNVKQATAAAILGFTPKKDAGFTPGRNVKIKAQWQGYYQNLLGLRTRLLAQMSGLAKDSAEEMSSYSLHMADSGTDNFDRDFALSLLSSDQDAIYEIEDALKRIEKATFGICEQTEKVIPKARLDAIPWTRYTVEAQAILERDGALNNRKLGSLGTIDGTVTADSEDSEPEEKPTKSND